MENKKFSLTTDDFLFLDKMMIEIGYHRMTENEQKKSFKRLGLISPREITGREVSYFYTNNFYTSIVHTTYLDKENVWRKTGEDSGWVLIRELDKAIYFARPFKRTSGFILKILRYAWVTKWKVDNRPLCPVCDAYMHIHRKKKSRQYFWMCGNKALHLEDNPLLFLPWDYKLPKKALEFIKIRRLYTEKYNRKNKEKGIERTPSAVIRKKWIISKPSNLA